MTNASGYDATVYYVDQWGYAHWMSTNTATSIQLVGVPFCPDLLRYEDIGSADNWRGRVVRAFFWVMRWWKA